MKRKILVVGMAALLVFVLALPGCDTSGGGGNGSGGGKTNLIGGKIGNNISFSVIASSGGKSVRAAVGATLTPISGQLQYGSAIINLEGFYDPASHNFIFAGAAGNNAYEFFGYAQGGTAVGKIKTKDGSGKWTEEVITFQFDTSVWVSGTAQTSAARLPEKWTGKWRPFQDPIGTNNSQLVEQWGVMHESEMILSPHSISFWFDAAERVAHVNYTMQGVSFTGVDGDTAENYRKELMFEQVYNRQSAFSIFEITANGSAYDVLASRTVTKRDDFDLNKFNTTIEYIKLRFQDGTGANADELWITFCTFGGGDFDTKTDNIATARSTNNFDVDRSKWGDGDNKTMLVAKR